MDTTTREALVLDFLRALGFDPDRVSEVHITPDSLTVRGYRADESGRIHTEPSGDVVRFENTFPLRWTAPEKPIDAAAIHKALLKRKRLSGRGLGLS